MTTKRLSINMAANLLAFTVNIGINFFLTPYIIKTVGTESFGFVGLATNFVNYASLLTIALNSMAGRFITINIYQNNLKEANKYYNSVLLANTFIAIILLVLSIICVFNLNQLLNISSGIYKDVQILFALLFMNFIVSTIGSIFAIATFAKNRLDLSSLRGIESNLLRASLLIGLFYFFEPSIAYLGIAALSASFYVLLTNIYYTKKLLPELKVKKFYFDIKSIKELLSSGIWNTIIRLGQLLLDGIDLLVANLFLGATAMGTLALAKTVPMFITYLVGVLAGVFMPNFTIQYARNNIKELIKDIKQSMKIMGIIVGIPISMLIAFGDIFYSLWTPSENSWELQLLSIISVATIIISGSINPIYNVFTVTNKLKHNALWLIGTGALNTIIVLVLLKTTSLGLYAIAGVSTTISIMRNLIFTAPYGAKYLGAKWNTFFSEIIKSIVSISIITMLALFLRIFININTWTELFLFGSISSLLGLIINCFLILTKEERGNLLKIIKRTNNKGE
ncbi:oligosaccharide flippase family protein [Exiguobacterium sp. s56]|uniref:lipopolysaccharide biosynthesis protein n=1 Tax=Exiguobacterium sp. s56 TaxID=2751232 RepID=UPI001BE4F5EB|nr:oligosaccharide flippase family protein [Exiguobacterium sp. s56]